MGMIDSPSNNKMRVPGEKGGSESESVSSGNKSGDNSPSASPYSDKRLLNQSSGLACKIINY